MSRAIRDSIWMGTICAPIGLVLALVAISLKSTDYESWFFLQAVPAAFFGGVGSWWLVVARPGRSSIRRATWTGALAALLGHYLCCYLILLTAWVCYRTTGECRSSLGEVPSDPLSALGLAAGFALLSLVCLGWVTVPAGALAGRMFARHLARDAAPPP